MSLQKLQELGRAAGVSSGDVALLHANGLTLGVVEQSADKLGIDIAGLLQLFQQFGPPFIAILTTLLSLVKKPQPAPTPAPAPEPAPAPAT